MSQTKIDKYIMDTGSENVIHCHDDKSIFEAMHTIRILKYGGKMSFVGCTNDQ